MTAAVILLFGLALGSFLNVCIHRLPRGESVVRPGSHCPHCRRPLAPYDNIPLVSYLLLRGRCRACRAPISPLYPAVEALTAVVLLGTYFRFGLTPAGLKAAVLAAALIVLTITDLRTRILPDAITLPGIAAGLFFAVWVPMPDGTAARLLGAADWKLPPLAVSLAEGLLGAAFGAGLLFLLGEVWQRLRGVEAMGLGDVKMMAMVGAFLGLQLTLLTLLLGSLAGSVLGGLFILLAKKGTRYELPLGSFLGAGALVALLWGRSIIAAYLGLFSPGPSP